MYAVTERKALFIVWDKTHHSFNHEVQTVLSEKTFSSFCLFFYTCTNEKRTW